MTKTRKLMTFKHTLLAATALLGLAVSTPRAQANIFQTGDVVVYDPGSTNYYVFNPTTQSSSEYTAGYSFFSNAYNSVTSFGAAGILYSTGSGVNEINQSGVNSTFLTAATGDTITTVMADAHNNVFVAGTGPSSTNFISEYTSTGTLVSTHTFGQPSGGGGIALTEAALSANEQTLYFNNINNYGSPLYTYNLSTGSVQSAPGNAGIAHSAGIQVLPNGDIVTADSFSGGINIYSPSGATITSYSITAFSVSPDATGSGLWVATPNGNGYSPTYFNSSGVKQIYSNNILSLNWPAGVAVIGAATAINSSSATAAPEPAALPLLAGMLGLLAMVKLGMSKSIKQSETS